MPIKPTATAVKIENKAVITQPENLIPCPRCGHSQMTALKQNPFSSDYQCPKCSARLTR